MRQLTGQSAPPPPLPKEADVPAAGASPAQHVVRPGETLSGIAKDHGITLARLLERNPRFAPNPNLIRPGDTVLL